MLDRPDTVRGRHVVDLASDSGLVGIAAMKEGAVGVTEADIDTFVIAAAELTAYAIQVILRSCLKDVLDVQPNDR